MRFHDALIGCVIILLGVAVLWHAQSFPSMGDGRPGPGLFPTVLSSLFILSGIVLCIQARHSKAPLCARLPELDAKGLCNLALALASIVFFVLVSEHLGFLLTSFLCMSTLMLTLRAKVLTTVLTATGTTLFIYAVFHKLLMVPLPRGILYF